MRDTSETRLKLKSHEISSAHYLFFRKSTGWKFQNNFKPIKPMKWELWTKVISRDMSLRWVSDKDLILQNPQNTNQNVVPYSWKKYMQVSKINLMGLHIFVAIMFVYISVLINSYDVTTKTWIHVLDGLSASVWHAISVLSPVEWWYIMWRKLLQYQISVRNTH